MENASKALLIAAGVLIAILLIAFGVKTFSSTTKTTDGVEDTIKITNASTFNNKFLQHTGMNKTMSDVKAIANVVIANNASNPNHQVSLYMPSSDLSSLSTYDDATEIMNIISRYTGNKRHIMVRTTDANGYITQIQISNKLD